MVLRYYIRLVVDSNWSLTAPVFLYINKKNTQLI